MWKLIERSAKRLYVDTRLLLKFQTRYPSVVSLPGSQHPLAVNPHDQRVRKKILGDWLVRGRIPRNQRLWKQLVEQVVPTVALDIGLNYGECLFSADYPSETKVFGFEGNVLIRPSVETSRDLHPHCHSITPVFQLVSDHVSSDVNFYVHNNWSGGSTAGQIGSDNRDFTKVITQSTTIDAVMQKHQVDTSRVVFKIDVEGYEARVIAGMRDLFDSAKAAIGFIEFSPGLLERSGENVHQFWHALQSQFKVSTFNRADHLADCSDFTLSDLRAYCGKSFHTDLLLVKHNSEIELTDILENWTDKRRAA